MTSSQRTASLLLLRSLFLGELCRRVTVHGVVSDKELYRFDRLYWHEWGSIGNFVAELLGLEAK